MESVRINGVSVGVTLFSQKTRFIIIIIIIFTFKKERLLQHTGDNEVSALARLTFYENLFIG